MSKYINVSQKEYKKKKRRVVLYFIEKRKLFIYIYKKRKLIPVKIAKCSLIINNFV
jgi:hypothetical protein